MKSFIVKRYGKKEKLLLTETAEPVVKDNDVLVQIYATGVNPLNAEIQKVDTVMTVYLPIQTQNS